MQNGNQNIVTNLNINGIERRKRWREGSIWGYSKLLVEGVTKWDWNWDIMVMKTTFSASRYMFALNTVISILYNTAHPC